MGGGDISEGPEGWLSWSAHLRPGGACKEILSRAPFLLFRSGSGFELFVSYCGPLCPICAHMQLSLASSDFFGSCCWRRRLSSCKSCSQGSQVWPLSLECGDFGVVTLDAGMEVGFQEESGRPELSPASGSHSSEPGASAQPEQGPHQTLALWTPKSRLPASRLWEATACGLHARDASAWSSIPPQHPGWD